MRALHFCRVLCLLTILAQSAGADSIHLRNGRHLQGKYMGGTTTAIGFMTERTVEYFAISDVMAVVFDGNSDSPLNAQPNAMKEGSTEVRALLRPSGVKPRRSKPELKRVNAASSVVAD